MKRTIFIGQAMPRHKLHPHDWPSLNNWFYSIGLTNKDIEAWFYYSALVDYFPGSKNGSHLVPTPEEITKERPRLLKTIRDFDPEIVVPIGKLSLSCCLETKIGQLKDYIGQSYSVDPYRALGRPLTIIPLPHSSGASTWIHNPQHKLLLKKALRILKMNLS